MTDYELGWAEGADGPVLRVAMRGFWPEARVADFGRDLAAAVRAGGGRPFTARVDLSGLPPQSGAVIALQSEVVLMLERAGLTRLDFVGAGALIRLQARRAAAASGVEVRFAEAEAEAEADGRVPA